MARRKRSLFEITYKDSTKSENQVMFELILPIFPNVLQSFEDEVCEGLVSHPDFAFHCTHWVSTHFPWTILCRALVLAMKTRLISKDFRNKIKGPQLLPTSPSTPTLPGLQP